MKPEMVSYRKRNTRRKMGKTNMDTKKKNINGPVKKSKYFERNENKNTAFQYLWDAAKVFSSKKVYCNRDLLKE